MNSHLVLLACIASVSARVRRESWDEFFFLLPLELSRYNLTGNACYAGYVLQKWRSGVGDLTSRT